MKQIPIIDACAVCPYIEVDVHMYGVDQYTCRKMDRDFDDESIIQVWCPLEDVHNIADDVTCFEESKP